MTNAEIIAIGSELLTPTKTDTNSLWLTDQLNSLGVEVVEKSIVGDDRARLTHAVRDAAARSGLVLITGGLGPTEDDVTRDAVAAALGAGQTFRPELLDQIAARFRRINRPMAENNKRQAFLIDGAEALENDRGTAPGQWIRTQSGSHIALLPGPPREMKGMWEQQILPRIQALLPPAVIRTRFYRVSGMGESDLDQLIAPVYSKYVNPATTILAAPGDIQIHLRARCSGGDEAEALLAEVGTPIEELLGSRIYTKVGDPLEKVVGDLLVARGETVAVAESLTGGMLGERLTRTPGSSRFFQGGFLTYNDEAKQNLLGIPEELLKKHTAVSEPVAEAMALAARERLGTSWGVSTTGYAGPDGIPGTGQTGIVYICVSSRAEVSTRRFEWGGDRERVRLFSTIWALDLLRQYLSRT